MSYQRPTDTLFYVAMQADGLTLIHKGQELKFTHDKAGRANARAVIRGLIDFAEAENIDSFVNIKREVRANTLRAAARIARCTKGGFSANLCFGDSPEQPELVRDEDGPWVLNGAIAERIESVQLTADGRFQSPEAERLWKEASDREGERLHEQFDGNGRPRVIR